MAATGRQEWGDVAMKAMMVVERDMNMGFQGIHDGLTWFIYGDVNEISWERIGMYGKMGGL